MCPNGCKLSVCDESGELVISGNTCKRGEEFARAELCCPKRSLTTTMRTAFSDMPYLPVRTDGEIPKDKIPSVMEAINSVTLRRRVRCRDTVLENAAGTGVNIIATATMC